MSNDSAPPPTYKGNPSSPDTKTVRMDIRAYNDLMEVRRLMTRNGGENVLPPEYADIARESLATNQEAFSRQAMHSIAARVLLAVAQKYRRSLLREEPSAPETSHEESVARADATVATRKSRR